MSSLIEVNPVEIDMIDITSPPEVPQGFWENVGLTVKEEKKITLPAHDNGDKLNNLVARSLEVAEETLNLDPSDYSDAEMQVKVMSMRKDMAVNLINAGLKADENRFRRENKDVISRLFEKIAAEKVIKTIQG